MKYFLTLIGLVFACSLQAGETTGNISAHSVARPNIIFIFTDDFGWGDLGSYGGKLAPTPNLDRMAAEGTRFTQFYVASPICSPSRTGVTTGMFPARWRITSFLQERKGNAACEQADFLDVKAPSVARLLKSAGYATGHFGKWHMGGGRDVTNAPHIAEYGFDEWASTWESPDPHPDLTATNWIWSPQDKVKRWDRTAFFVDKTLDFLKRHTDQPCYINLWPDDTHAPYVLNEAMKEKYPRDDADKTDLKLFQGVLDEYDRQIGRLFDGLKQLGLATNTLVVFTGDNGPAPSYQQQRTAGLRGIKLSLYEGGTRLPLIVWWPGQTPAGKVNEQSVLSTLDFLPTFCHFAGAKIPADISAKLDGEDAGAAFTGATPARGKTLFWEYGRNEKAFKYPAQKLHRSPNVAVREGNWKLLINADGSGAQLFHIVADPKEEKDLAATEPERVKKLSAVALTWRKSLP